VRFVGSTIVPIEGVDFDPYLHMLLTSTDAGRIGQRVAVLTDTDPGKRVDPIRKLRALIASLGAADIAQVFAAPSTLEPELYEAQNEAFWPAWAEQRPRGALTVRAKVEATDDRLRRAAILISSMKTTRLRKGDFAQDLLDHAAAREQPLRVPDYIREALTWLVRPQ
jgi:putative ATP-dependent endonuclease of OLD family